MNLGRKLDYTILGRLVLLAGLAIIGVPVQGERHRHSASIEAPAVIERILEHLGRAAGLAGTQKAPYTHYPLPPPPLTIRRTCRAGNKR